MDTTCRARVRYLRSTFIKDMTGCENVIILNVWSYSGCICSYGGNFAGGENLLISLFSFFIPVQQSFTSILPIYKSC